MQQWTQILIILFFTVLTLGDCAVVLQCGEVCLEDVAQYTCTIDDATSLDWTVPNPQNSQETDMLSITIFTNSNVTDDTDTFTAVLTDDDPFVSTLSFMTTNQLNNKEIVCLSGGNSKKCTIMILGSPSVPLNTSVTAIGPNTVIVSWSPPLNSSQCIDHYVVSIVNGNSISNKITSNTTLVINQLIQGMNYSFSVTGVDRAERTGEESETPRITLDVPESVIDLNSTLTNDESLYLITVMITWKPPSVTLRPPVTDYHVYHNITSCDGSLVHNVTNNMTHITFTNVSRRRQYIVNVTGENIIGIGEESLLNVLIPLEPTVSSTSSNNIVTALSFTAPVNTATAVSPTSTSLQSKCSTTIVIAVSVPVAVVISSLITGIITFLITCITMRKRYTKHSTVSANIQLQSPGGSPVYDTPQWNKNQDNELHVETNKAYGHIKL